MENKFSKDMKKPKVNISMYIIYNVPQQTKLTFKTFKIPFDSLHKVITNFKTKK